MGKLVHIGFGNMVNEDKMIAVVSYDASPIKRMVQHAKEQELVVDATSGRKTKAVIVMDGNRLVLSALLPETILARTEEV